MLLILFYLKKEKEKKKKEDFSSIIYKLSTNERKSLYALSEIQMFLFQQKEKKPIRSF
jgi:hypothetical protein